MPFGLPTLNEHTLVAVGVPNHVSKVNRLKVSYSKLSKHIMNVLRVPRIWIQTIPGQTKRQERRGQDAENFKLPISQSSTLRGIGLLRVC